MQLVYEPYECLLFLGYCQTWRSCSEPVLCFALVTGKQGKWIVPLSWPFFFIALFHSDMYSLHLTGNSWWFFIRACWGAGIFYTNFKMCGCWFLRILMFTLDIYFEILCFRWGSCSDLEGSMGIHQRNQMDCHPGFWGIFYSLQRSSLQIQMGNALLLTYLQCLPLSLDANFTCDGNQATISLVQQYFLQRAKCACCFC